MCDSFSESVTKILTAIKERSSDNVSLDPECQALAKPGLVRDPRPFTVMVEGNIGSGKSTYLKHFNRHRSDVDIIMEPVDKWRDLNSHNLLQMMYEDPERWSLVFQTYVQLTMLETHTKLSNKPVKMMERSLHSAKYCFVENLRKTGKMHETEYQVLSSWFDFLLSSPEIDISVDLIVYLQTKPEVALERVRARSRGEEHLISEDYIQQLHNLHEDWLIGHKFPVPAPVVVVDANKDVKDMKLVFEKITELFQQSKEPIQEKSLENDDNKENSPNDCEQPSFVKNVTNVKKTVLKSIE